MHAIVFAGGRGRRLHPHTERLPKALVSIGGEPLLEILLAQLQRCGFRRVTLCIGFLGEMIRTHIGTGAAFGVEVDYVVEDEPLGSAGALALVPDWRASALVLNADLLTSVPYDRVLAHHEDGAAAFTVVARPHQVVVDKGVVEVEDGMIRSVDEKPTLVVTISAGIYAATPEVRDHIHGPIDMPELVTRLLGSGAAVAAYPDSGAWFDIGTPTALDQARRAFVADRSAFLGGTVKPAGDREADRDGFPSPGTRVVVQPPS